MRWKDCEYAACRLAATGALDGWHLCSAHAKAHRALTYGQGEPPREHLDRAFTLMPCGTESAYRRHLRRGEQPCVPCTEANAARQRRRASA